MAMQEAQLRQEQVVARPQFKVPRIPGDIMIYPMILGLLLNSFAPQVLNIGSFTTSLVKGSGVLVFIILLGVGAGINIKATPGVIKTGLAILVPKLAISIALGLAVAFYAGNNLFGLSALSIIGGVSFCNVALYIGIMSQYGSPVEQGAAGMLCLTAGPTITMIALGVAGLAAISIPQLIGALLPLVLGIVMGNTSPFLKKLFEPGVNGGIALVGFSLGCGMSLESLMMGGLSGVLLAVVAIAVGVASTLVDRLVGGSGKAGVACGTIAGTAMTTPAAVAAIDATYTSEMVALATAQIAAAVIITAFVAPLLTGWIDKKFPRTKQA